MTLSEQQAKLNNTIHAITNELRRLYTEHDRDPKDVDVFFSTLNDFDDTWVMPVCATDLKHDTAAYCDIFADTPDKLAAWLYDELEQEAQMSYPDAVPTRPVEEAEYTRYLLITPSGNVRLHKSYDYKDLQAAVGGLLTTAPVRSDDIIPGDSTVFANDEGLLIGLQPNAVAQMVTGYPYLVGNILIGGSVNEYGETQSIADETILRILQVTTLVANESEVNA